MMERSCVGCHTVADPSELVRVVLAPDGTLVPDARGGTFGRGAWLHPVSSCLERAVKGGLARALRAEVRSDAEELARLLRAAGTRRLLGLIGAAFRAKKAALGATATEDAIEHGRARLVVMAKDARAAGTGPGVLRAGAAGRALLVASKVELGRALGRDELGVIAILDEEFEAPLRQAAALAELEAPKRAGRAAQPEAL